MRDRDRRRVRERLEGLTEAGLDADDARFAAIEALRPAVGFDRWCWPLTDPASGLSTSGVGEFDFAASLPRLVALEEHGDVTSKTALFAGESASVSLSGATAGDLARSIRWRECLRPYGIGDEVMTVCRDRHGWWGSVELMRSEEDAPFDEDVVRFLDELAPTLGGLLRRSGRATSPRREPEPTSSSPGTLILDRDLNAVGWTGSFHQWVDALPALPGMLPPAVYELGARALAPASVTPNRVRIRTLDGRWAVLEGAVLEGTPELEVAITVRAATTWEVFELLVQTYGLTPRERELAAAVLEGMATKQLAHALSISAYTVQDHLKAIFAKTGTRTRGELVSALTGG